MWTNGISTAAAIWSATRCMVLVHSTSSSVPPATSAWASAARSLPASFHRPVRWSSSTAAKSTDRSRQSAECKPPSRFRTASLTNR